MDHVSATIIIIVVYMLRGGNRRLLKSVSKIM